jgi:hypothetical protein
MSKDDISISSSSLVCETYCLNTIATRGCLWTRRQQTHLQPQTPLLVNQNPFIPIFSQRHSPNILQRRPYVFSKHRPRRNHILFYLDGLPFPIREYAQLLARITIGALLRPSLCGFAHGVRVKAAHYDRRRREASIVTARCPAVVMYRRRVRFKPPRHGDASRISRDDRRHRTMDRTERCAGRLRARDVRDEGAGVYDECERTRLVEELCCVRANVFD